MSGQESEAEVPVPGRPGQDDGAAVPNLTHPETEPGPGPDSLDDFDKSGLWAGRCRYCGETRWGTFVAYIEQCSGPGVTVIVCAPCERNPPKPPPDAEKPRTYQG
jgi:hypothetical protein